jgi:hypothetical protein
MFDSMLEAADFVLVMAYPEGAMFSVCALPAATR